MDANEDWSYERTGKSLKKFMDDLKLHDQLYERFHGKGLVESMHLRGRRRITLGLHHAIVSDHVMVYADIDEKELFQGLINRRVRVLTREFILAQADKCKLFLEGFKEVAKERKFDHRANQLHSRLAEGGLTEVLVREYNILDAEIQEHLIEVAGARVKKKYGYSRSPELGRAGMNLNFWKTILSSKQLRREPSQKSKNMAEKLNIDIEEVQELSKEGARKAVRVARDELREVQYQSSQHRQAWIERNAQNPECSSSGG
jgi:hypothetical protein